MDARLLDILVCPICKGNLEHRKAEKELICKPCKLAFPIRDDIPIMLEDEARQLTAEEVIMTASGLQSRYSGALCFDTLARQAAA
jgi:uncharacterized protein YbaR (Trm112 family)